ncbi:hypothetical protein ACN9MU_23170 [Pseudoduganella sp. R-32]|uniref:hypothetical protein n=1 Tax=Pseudoduganella sp. R-32 TaxID=3404061 RepID=UPI003CEFC53C
MMRAILLLLLVLAPLCALAAKPACPARDGGEEWSPLCFTVREGVRQLKPQYLRKLAFEKSGKALIVIDGDPGPNEVVALDRRGRVVVPGIYHTGDFDYPYAPLGVGRFRENGKCGYFQSSTFKIVVQAEYDHCHPFHVDGIGSACKECEYYCTHPDCYDSALVGGQGFDFDARGKLLETYVQPGLDRICPHGFEKLDEKSHYLECKDDPDSPFRHLR